MNNMKLWITRDADGAVYLHMNKPYLQDSGIWTCTDQEYFWLDGESFSEVTFENSPQEVKLTLCNHIDTVNIQDCNPKKQTCVLTNHGIVTDVIFK